MFQKWFFDLLEFLEQSHNPGVWTHWSVSEYTLVEVRDSPRWGNTSKAAKERRKERVLDLEVARGVGQHKQSS